jgi:uncharacterized membrane protein
MTFQWYIFLIDNYELVQKLQLHVFHTIVIIGEQPFTFCENCMIVFNQPELLVYCIHTMKVKLLFKNIFQYDFIKLYFNKMSYNLIIFGFHNFVSYLPLASFFFNSNSCA